MIAGSRTSTLSIKDHVKYLMYYVSPAGPVQLMDFCSRYIPSLTRDTFNRALAQLVEEQTVFYYDFNGVRLFYLPGLRV